MKSILVPVDFSHVTETVVRTAATWAEVFHAAVVLIHVASPPPEAHGWGQRQQDVIDDPDHSFTEQRRELQNLTSGLQAAGCDARFLLRQGAIVDRILEETRQLRTQMIITGSHGHGAVYDMLVGGVAEGVLRKADCPVLVVPDPRDHQKYPAERPSKEPSPPERILIPVDFSRVTESIIKTSEIIAKSFQSTIHLMHVKARDVAVTGGDFGFSFLDDSIATEEHKMGQMVGRLRAHGCRVESIFQHGSPVKLIVGEVNRLNIDLVIIGSHGHSALYDLLIGSVADGVMRKVGCPVLLIPDPGRSEAHSSNSESSAMDSNR